MLDLCGGHLLCRLVYMHELCCRHIFFQFRLVNMHELPCGQVFFKLGRRYTGCMHELFGGEIFCRLV